MSARHAKKATHPKHYYVLASVLASSVFLLSGFNIYNATQKKADTIVVDDIDTARTYWQQFIEKHPSFRDGYLILARLEYDKGNIAAAYSLLEAAGEVDPFSERVNYLSRVLGAKSSPR